MGRFETKIGYLFEGNYLTVPSINRYWQDFPPFRNPENQKTSNGRPYIVPKGMVFAMGDNQDLSSDSRTWGPVDIDDIKGQAIMVMGSTAN